MLIRKIGTISYSVHWKNTRNNDYSRFSTCIEYSWYFWETIATERLEKALLFLRKYHDSKAVALKEYYDYSPISTYTESCQYFQETIATEKMWIYRKQERDT